MAAERLRERLCNIFLWNKGHRKAQAAQCLSRCWSYGSAPYVCKLFGRLLNGCHPFAEHSDSIGAGDNQPIILLHMTQSSIERRIRFWRNNFNGRDFDDVRTQDLQLPAQPARLLPGPREDRKSVV